MQPPYQQPQMPPPQPPRQPNFWTRKVGCLPMWVLILFIALFACAGINAAAKSGSNTTTDTTATTATTQATQADQPTQPIPTQEPPTATSAPQLQSVHDWHGKGTQKTEVFSMQGTWHVQWFCLGNSPDPSDNFSDYLTINLYNAGTGKILKTWQHNCTTDRFEEVVRYSGDFRLEGIVTQQTIEYHIAVLQ
jgi:hypothetical protein